MNNYIDSICKSVDSENWYTALSMSLLMPDICSKQEFPNKSSNKRFPEWFNKYRIPTYKGHLSGEDCYALRCSLIHEGQSNIEHQHARQIVDYFTFTPKGSHLITMRDNNFGSDDDGKHITVLSVYQFALDMVQSSLDWLDDVKEIREVQNRISNMIEIKGQHSFYNGGISIQ